MNILIAGGSGFLGSALTDALLSDNHHVYWLSTRAGALTAPQGVTVMAYDDLMKLGTPIDVVINLAGAGIADKRWSAKRKDELLSSRLMPTQYLVDFIEKFATPPQLLISGSAIGYYGVQSADDMRVLDERSDCTRADFAHVLCSRWEQLALSAQTHTSVAIIRTGVVLDAHGGMMTRLLPAFRLGVGGRLGTGQQMMSPISVRDWVAAVRFIMAHHRGGMPPVYNLTSPQALNNRQFTQTIATLLHRPAFLHLPSFVLKLILGEMATLLIDGQRVYPKRLLDAGFVFNDVDLSFLQEQL